MVQTGAFLYALIGYHTKPCKIMVQDTIFVSFVTSIHNYNKNCVVYTGTHDNETLLGWLDNILPEEVEMVKKYVGRDTKEKKELVSDLIRVAQSSVADYCIIPIQDYLCLDNGARINTPSTVGTNWKWRVSDKQLSNKLAEKIKEYAVVYGRI